MTIAVTGAGGALGRSTAERLLKTVDPREVVLVSRRPEQLEDLADGGATVRRGDFDDRASLASALQGVERLLLISTDAVGRRVGQHTNAVEAAMEAGVRQVAYTSVPGASADNPAFVVPDHVRTELMLIESGLRWTFLRNNLYAHMQAATLRQAAASGQFVCNTAGGAAAYVDREDCAAAAAAVLTQDGHENRAYDVTGPAALSARDLAAVAASTTGRPVEVIDVDDAAYETGLADAGLPAELAHGLATFGASTRLGFLSTVTPVVETLSGRRPRSLDDIVREALA